MLKSIPRSTLQKFYFQLELCQHTGTLNYCHTDRIIAIDKNSLIISLHLIWLAESLISHPSQVLRVRRRVELLGHTVRPAWWGAFVPIPSPSRIPALSSRENERVLVSPCVRTRKGSGLIRPACQCDNASFQKARCGCLRMWCGLSAAPTV